MRSPTLLAAACLALAGCDDSTGPAPSELGTLVVTTSTIGGDPDLDGYQLRLDHSVAFTLDPVGEQTLVLTAGSHILTFADVAPNCTLGGDAVRSVTLAPNATERLQYSVTCLHTGITVSSTASGIDLDASGTQVLIDGTARGTVSANGSLTVSRLAPGEHTLALTGIAPNCTLDGSATRTVTVVNAELTPVAISATCLSTYGVVHVEVTTTGPRPDPEYTVDWSPSPTFDPLSSQIILSTEVFHESPVTGIQYLRLSGVAPNCAVLDGAVRQAEVQLGTPVRDTAVVSFHVECHEGNGTFRVTVSASGSEAPDKFTLRLYEEGCTDPYYCPAARTFDVAANGVTNVVVPSARYLVELGVGSTCQAVAGSIQELAIGQTVELEFATTCSPPLVRVTAPTTGVNPDDQYTVILFHYDYYYGTYETNLGPLAAGATLEYVLPFPDFVWVELRDVAANCTVGSANPSAGAWVGWGVVLEVAFPVTCGP